MNMKDRNVLNEYAHALAFPYRFRPDWLAQAKAAYLFLIEIRYAKLYGWWRSLTDDQKNQWRAFYRKTRWDDELAIETVHTFLEFSRAFANDERAGMPFISQVDREMKDAWEMLRYAVWQKFRSMVQL